MKHYVNYYRLKAQDMISNGWRAWKIAETLGVSEEELRMMLAGKTPSGFFESKDVKYDIELTGRRLLDKPDWRLIRRVFGGSFERYRKCVIANFGECCVAEAETCCTNTGA